MPYFMMELLLMQTPAVDHLRFKRLYGFLFFKLFEFVPTNGYSFANKDNLSSICEMHEDNKAHVQL